MPNFYVTKRLIKDYEVKVTASTPVKAILKALEGLHGQPTERPESSDTFYPSAWIVRDKSGKEIEFDTSELEEFE